VSPTVHSIRAQPDCIYTVAGTGVGGYDETRTVARDALLNSPNGLAAASDGGFWVAVEGSHRVLRVRPDGTITLAAGAGGSGNTVDTGSGSATAAQMNGPSDIAAASDGGLWISDSFNGKVRRVHPDGTISTLQSSGLNLPRGLAALSGGGVIVASSGSHRIFTIPTGGGVTAVAGTGSVGIGGSGGSATDTALSSPQGVAIAADGSYYVADTDNYCVRRVTSGVSTTVAGVCGSLGMVDGVAAATAQFRGIKNVVQASDGTWLIVDTGNHRVRRMRADGTVITVAGIGAMGVPMDGTPAATQPLNDPRGIALAPDGGFWIASTGSHRVHRVLPASVCGAAGMGTLSRCNLTAPTNATCTIVGLAQLPPLNASTSGGACTTTTHPTSVSGGNATVVCPVPSQATTVTVTWTTLQGSRSGTVASDPSPTPTPSITTSPSLSTSQSASRSTTGSASAAVTPSVTASPTGTVSGTMTGSHSGSGTGTQTATGSATLTNTASQSGTASSSNTPTGTNTATSSPSVSASQSVTSSPSSASTPTQTPSASISHTVTGTSSISATMSSTPTPTSSATRSTTITTSPTPTRTRLPASVHTVVVVITLRGLAHRHASNIELHAVLQTALGGHIPSAVSIRVTLITSMTGAPLFNGTRRLQGSAETAGVNVTLAAAAADQATASTMAAQVAATRAAVAASVQQALTTSPSLPADLRAEAAADVTVLVGGASVVSPDTPPPSPPLPIGAIVGGAVGGLFVIGLVVGGWCYVRRRARRRSDITPAGTGDKDWEGHAPTPAPAPDAPPAGTSVVDVDPTPAASPSGAPDLPPLTLTMLPPGAKPVVHAGGPATSTPAAPSAEGTSGTRSDPRAVQTSRSPAATQSGGSAVPPLPPTSPTSAVPSTVLIVPGSPDNARLYSVQGELGSGSFGVAQLAVNTVSGKQVVIKTTRAAVDARAMREVDTLAKVREACGSGAAALHALCMCGWVATWPQIERHPNIVQLQDWWQDADGHLHIVMEYAEGGDLPQYVARQSAAGTWSTATALRLMLDVAEGLKFAHAAGIAHRDIKPDNVLVTRAGRAMLGDWGLAREHSNTGSIASKGIGSPLWMAPELLDMPDKYDAFAADVWSLGILWYQLLRADFPSDTRDDNGSTSPFFVDGIPVLRSVREGSPHLERLPADVPPEIVLLLRDALMKDPGARPKATKVVGRLLSAPEPAVHSPASGTTGRQASPAAGAAAAGGAGAGSA
jgi:serine/threonine protein kinase/sugar lactone lactonase YvrE